MKLKYFHYISKTKVDMLYAQVQRKQFHLPDISPKVEFAGLSVSADFKSQSNQDLIERTLSLTEAMKKKKLVGVLANNAELETSSFYQDESTWYNGLYSFDASRNIEIVTYFLWRIWEDSIILLAGSPLNVLGEKVIRDGVYAPSTGSVWDEVINFVRENFQTDEVNFVGLNTTFPPKVPRVSESDLPREWEQALGDIPLIGVNQEWLATVLSPIEKYEKYVEADETIRRSIYRGYSLGALGLSIFCIKHLRRLPQNRIDTAFKVFRKMELDRPKELQLWISQINKLSLEQAQSRDLEKCRCIYIGSPIYTARA